MAYICGNTPFRAGGSEAYLHIRTFMQQLLKYGLWPCLCTLKYVLYKTYFNVWKSEKYGALYSWSERDGVKGLFFVQALPFKILIPHTVELLIYRTIRKSVHALSRIFSLTGTLHCRQAKTSSQATKWKCCTSLLYCTCTILHSILFSVHEQDFSRECVLCEENLKFVSDFGSTTT